MTFFFYQCFAECYLAHFVVYVPKLIADEFDFMRF